MSDIPQPPVPQPPVPQPPVPESQPPRSALAAWALGTSLLLAAIGLFSGLVWLLLVPAFVLAVLAFRRTRTRAMRGQGLALAALVVAVLAGSCQYMASSALRQMIEHLSAGAIAAAAAEDEALLDAWLTEEARERGAGAEIRARYELVAEQMGPFRREVSAGSSISGMLPVFVPPKRVMGVGPGDESTYGARWGAFWSEAVFERGIVYVAVRFSQNAGDIDAEEIERGRPLPVLDDVRFYLPEGDR